MVDQCDPPTYILHDQGHCVDEWREMEIMLS